MAKGFKHGGGGAPAAALNFTVVGGAERPSAPGENTVWVNAEAISGWVLSPIQPEASEGMVWVETGTESDVAFNLLKKNGVYVYPVSVSLYSAGAWTAAEAWIYQNGAWSQFSEIVTTLWLYDNGNTFDDVTGGWGSDYTYGQYGHIDAVFNPGSFTVTGGYGGSYSSACVCGTKEPVDLTNISRIKADVEITAAGTVRLLAGSTKNAAAAEVYGEKMQAGTHTLSIDVSGLDGAYYIALMAIGNSNYYSPSATCTRVWGEPEE